MKCHNLIESRMKCHKRVLTVAIVCTLVVFLTFSLFVQNNSNIEIRPTLKILYSDNMPTTQDRTSGKPTTTMKKIVQPPVIDSHIYDYVILENSTCQVKDITSAVFLVIVVCVSPGNAEHRKVIRETWGSIGKSDPEVRIVFLVGDPRNPSVQIQLHKESKEYRDIIQEDFVDSYRNLSIKSVALLKWVSLYCRYGRYILKVDDDMYINVPYLIRVLKSRKLSNSVIGCKIHGAVPIRDTTSKWYTPQELYGKATYPDYCSGTAYVLSSDIVPKLYEISKKTPLFWLEDIFVTGVCRTAIGANVVNDWGFTYTKPNPDGCTFRKRISGHQYSLQEVKNIWRELNDEKLKCK